MSCWDAETAFRCTLTVREWDLQIEFADWTELPEYPLVTLRGLLGYALKDFLHPGAHFPPAISPYWPLFKPGNHRPHPFLLEATPGAGRARVLHARLRTFGPEEEADRIGRLYLEALSHYGSAGFGLARTPYRLHVGKAPGREMPWSPAWRPLETRQFHLLLDTPAQLIWRNRPADETAPLPEIVARSGLRRLCLLAECFGGALEADWPDVGAAIAGVQVTRASLLRIADKRTSTADGDSIALGGLQGRLEIDCNTQAQRLFAIASVVAVGKHTNQGNGRVRLVARDCGVSDAAHAPTVSVASSPELL